MEKKLKKGGFISAMNLIGNTKSRKPRIKPKAFDSGSEGSRRGNSPDQNENQYRYHETDSELFKDEYDETTNRTIVTDPKR